ncbi:DsbA family protein [Streptacidiphilus carbonis]|uniref:DsbA family protein n=1 Tax=Streptacidiphilus carbonis TaxID=105422 RepID=UPI0005A9F596|nr:thioredoxin domain-containing protein [Streptacidiphilus carbonis]
MAQNKSRPTNQQRRDAARERMRAERERQTRRASRRKAAAIGAAIVVVIAAAAGISIALADHHPKSSSTALVLPAHSTGSNGTTVVYGKATSPEVLDVYEDFRCPVCDKFEKADAAIVQQLADNGTYVIHYHMGTFLDSNLGGNGSHRALAAAGAALNESTAMFKAWHDEIYANQPASEDTDSFSSTSFLLSLAKKVPGLSTPAFVKAVQDGTYLPWANKVSDAFNASGVTGTPTFKLNGKALTLFDSTGNPVSATQYTQAVQQAIAATKK